MKNLLLTTLALATATAFAGDDARTDRWLQQIGGGGPELVHDLAVTSDGRLCAAGTFWATVTFGTGINAKTMSTDGTQDIFVACLDATGELTSATQFGTHRGDEVRAIASLPDGDVVITGYFSKQFGASADEMLEARDSADIFVARLDRSGKQVWARRFGGADADSGAAIAVADNGDILLAGNFSGTMIYPVGERAAKLNSTGKADAMAMRLSGAGDVIWARRLGGKQYDQASAIAEGPDGRVLVGGVFEQAAALDGVEQGIVSHGYNDIFVASLQADGTPLWLRGLGGARQDTLNGLVVDAQGRIHLTGSFQGQFQAGTTTLDSNGSSDIFVVRLGSDGASEHAYGFGSAHTDQVFDLALRDDELILTGHFQGDTDFAPGAAVEIRRSARTGDSNAFLLTLDTDAQFRAVQTFGDIGVEMGFAVATLHKQRAMALAGVFNYGFDPKLDGLDALENRGKSDVFVLHNTEH